MRRLLLLLPLLMSPGCGSKPLALPDDPIDRAATCGVVAAAKARSAETDVQAPLGFDEQGRIMHYAMLAASEDGGFATDRAAAVVDRMPQLEAGITSGEWDALVQPCAAAYPATTKRGPVALPKDPLVAQQGCDALSAFLSTALRPQEHLYPELRAYEEMERKLDSRIGATQARRGGASFQASQAARGKALAELARLGPPMAVMRACLERYG